MAARYRPRVLIADDHEDVLTALRLLLKSEGFETVAARSPQEALSKLTGATFDAALVDMNYSRDTSSGREGLELVSRIKECSPDVPVIVMTAWGTIELAVEAIRVGARDFIQKPWDNGRLMTTLRTQLELARSKKRRALAG